MASTALTRWNPAREISTMRDVVDRLFDDSFFRPFRLFDGWTGLGSGFAMDLYEEGDNYVLEAALPGVRPGDVDISLQGNMLTIKGKVSEADGKEGRDYLVRELGSGEFIRTLTLPAEVNADQVNATFEHGMLRLVLPKTPAFKAKRIKIRSGK